jgi:hypothetical protein
MLSFSGKIFQLLAACFHWKPECHRMCYRDQVKLVKLILCFKVCTKCFSASCCFSDRYSFIVHWIKHLLESTLVFSFCYGCSLPGTCSSTLTDLCHYPELITVCLTQWFCKWLIIQTGYHVFTDIQLDWAASGSSCMYAVQSPGQFQHSPHIL